MIKPRRFLCVLLLCSGCTGGVKTTNAGGVTAVVIDAGHGGDDTGAGASFTLKGKEVTLLEKDITLEIARETAAFLQRKTRAQVLLTRTDDTFVSLEDRCRKVEETGGGNTLFVSIHVNNSLNPDTSGFEVYYYGLEMFDPARIITVQEIKSSYSGALLAKLVHAELSRNLGSSQISRGLKTADYYVLKNNSAPAALVECGFVSNPAEQILFYKKSYRKKIARAIASGIMDFLRNDTAR